MIKNRASAYEIDDALKVFNPEKDGPAWCFSRYAQSVSELENGSKIYIGGAYEDYYTAQFHVYNDVVVEGVDGRIQIYGYPTDVFPPTDYHSATVVGRNLYIVGNGWRGPEHASVGVPVYTLNLENFSIRSIPSNGDVPIGLRGHDADLSECGESVLFRGGSISHPNWSSVDNIDTWELSLKSGTWSRLTKKPWPRRVMFRKEWAPNRLRDIGLIAWATDTGRWSKWDLEKKAIFESEGHLPDLDLFKVRYSPPVPHIRLEEDKDEFRVYRISINGTTIVYREENDGVYITIEGELPANMTEVIFSDARRKLSTLENVPYTELPLDD